MAEFNRIESPKLPPCTRCGAAIGEDEESLLIFSKTDAEMAAEGNPRSLADFGDLTDAYCEKCAREIEEAHGWHDRAVEALKDDLDSYGN